MREDERGHEVDRAAHVAARERHRMAQPHEAAAIAIGVGADGPAFDFSVPGVTGMSMDLHKYALTPKGKDAYPIILTLMKWGDQWLATPAGPPLVLRHLPCRRRLDPVVVCDCCGDELDPHHVSFRRTPAALTRAPSR